ncbi:MlaD family protein [Hymenobacter antarcticus]|uniref:MlaD family protein n=1 Tax=Hymenobacter antarcticus TaxID=486270 RepID=A0ABP7QIN6_9BACT
MSKEIKVALLAIVAIVVLVFGYNFLRGSNLLSSDRTFYATYPDVDGLNVGAAVILNGIKVGQVKKMELMPEKGNAVRASLELEKGIVLGDSTLASLGGSLLGSKTITLSLGRNTKEFTGGEELKTESSAGIAGLATALQARALPVLTSLDSTLRHVNSIINKDAETNIQGTLLGARASTEALLALIASNQANVNQITRNFAQMSVALNKTTVKLDKIASNFSQLSDSLKSAPVGPALRRLDATLADAQTTVQTLNTALNDQKGSMGRLLHDSTLYKNLAATTASSNDLLVDLKANPKRYVHFSVFGGGGKDKSKVETTQKSDGTTKTEVKKVETSSVK